MAHQSISINAPIPLNLRGLIPVLFFLAIGIGITAMVTKNVTAKATTELAHGEAIQEMTAEISGLIARMADPTPVMIQTWFNCLERLLNKVKRGAVLDTLELALLQTLLEIIQMDYPHLQGVFEKMRAMIEEIIGHNAANESAAYQNSKINSHAH